LVGIVGTNGGYHADTCFWRVFLRCGGNVSRIQSFEARIEAFLSGCGFRFYGCIYRYFNFNDFSINILNLFYMTTVLDAGKPYDTSKQAVRENQIIVYYGQGLFVIRFAVYKVERRDDGWIYHLINVGTREIRQTDMVRTLNDRFGIGYYYDDENQEFMDAFEVAVLRNEAGRKAAAKREAQQKEDRRIEQLEAAGRERLQKLVPDDAKAVIVAKLRKDDSDLMTDYFGYSTVRTVILGFSNHTKDLFLEMRKFAANFDETAYLSEKNRKYEHREKYTGGGGYYLGKSNYGWIVKKIRYCEDKDGIIRAFAQTAGDEANICVKVREATSDTTEAVAGDFVIVDYSEKAIAVFGDTRQVKDRLKALGGRFNPKLSHEGGKRAGWIFSKNKENELRNLLTIK
jgi:hypothetical protein